MELGIATFADLASGIASEQRMRDLLEEAELGDQLGLDVFAIGEHHRPDFLVSAPAVPLAAIAARTNRIRLSSAVTVLSSDDPVRVFQQFAELDLISGGRAEIMAGRGSFIESFPLFGYELDDYDDLPTSTGGRSRRPDTTPPTPRSRSTLMPSSAPPSKRPTARSLPRTWR
jgi:alkanesulfonate monooxygenase SsuD/methylene tetrahydromethanopterin reductase-like flavin-dependent oxidoreductase (luciferase family)